MSLKNDMGLRLFEVEKELMSKGYLVIGTHDYYHYFTVENKEGLQVYCQVGDYCMGYDLTVNYKPNKKNGSGIQYKKSLQIENLVAEIEKAFNDSFTLSHVAKNGKPESIKNKIITGLKRQKMLGFREEEILKTLTEFKQNTEVPQNYYIFEFYNENGDGFEAGKKPENKYSEYSITA